MCSHCETPATFKLQCRHGWGPEGPGCWRVSRPNAGSACSGQLSPVHWQRSAPAVAAANFGVSRIEMNDHDERTRRSRRGGALHVLSPACRCGGESQLPVAVFERVSASGLRQAWQTHPLRNALGHLGRHVRDLARHEYRPTTRARFPREAAVTGERGRNLTAPEGERDE
jgi:hypothetical protein